MPKYNKRIVKQICELIKKDSYTIAEICSQSGISESTYYEWQATKKEFSESIQKAIDDRMKVFAAEAKKSLLKKIQGYTIQEKHTTMVDSKEVDPSSGKPKPKIKEQKIIDKHFQPDTAAIIFTLTNAEPENWKNRQNNELTGKGGKDLFASFTDDELDAKIAELEAKLAK
ncbi:hypothetical protein JZU61_04410 [bacterium]|jgi:hypothetical protein|nr:hypothetical protein [bacterium]